MIGRLTRSRSTPTPSMGGPRCERCERKNILYVQAPRRELYDQKADPNAEHNLASRPRQWPTRWLPQVEAFRQEDQQPTRSFKSTIDLAGQEQLGALGYMASGRDVSNGTPLDQGADPKDRIQIADMLHKAELLQQDMHGEESIALLEQVIAQEPGLALYSKLGDWMVREKEYKRAVPVLRKAMEEDRDSPMTHFQLGRAMVKAGDFENGVLELEITEAKMPQLIDAHLLLQMAYTQLNRVPDAIRESKTILAVRPGPLSELPDSRTISRLNRRYGRRNSEPEEGNRTRANVA